MMMATRQRQRSAAHLDAISTMQHYLKTAFEAAGLHWSSDNDEEVEGLCDNLVDAARGDDDD
jgi:hypothetical protein